MQLGMYQDADDAFIRAISYCQKHNIKSSYLWNVLYSDYIFNKTRLNPDISMEEMDEILEQYKEYIDCKNIVEYINLFNTRPVSYTHLDVYKRKELRLPCKDLDILQQTVLW